MKYLPILLISLITGHALTTSAIALENGISERNLSLAEYLEKVKAAVIKAVTAASTDQNKCSTVEPLVDGTCTVQTGIDAKPEICIKGLEESTAQILFTKPFQRLELTLEGVDLEKDQEDFGIDSYAKEFCEGLQLEPKTPEAIKALVEGFLTNVAVKDISVGAIDSAAGKIPVKLGEKNLTPLVYKIEGKKLTVQSIYSESSVEFTLTDDDFIQLESKRILTEVLTQYLRMTQFINNEGAVNEKPKPITCETFCTDATVAIINKQLTDAKMDGKISVSMVGTTIDYNATELANLKGSINCKPGEGAKLIELIGTVEGTAIKERLDLLEESKYKLEVFAHSFVEDFTNIMINIHKTDSVADA